MPYGRSHSLLESLAQASIAVDPDTSPPDLTPDDELGRYSQIMEPRNGQLNLAAMHKLAAEIGAFGDATACSVFLQGTMTAAKFRRAAEWLDTGELPP